MSTVLTEKKHDFGFLMPEAAGSRSRDRATLSAGNDLQPGALLKADTDNVTEFDGSGTVIAILGARCDATDADTPCVIIARDAEVNGNELILDNVSPVLELADVSEDLAAVGIIVR